MTFVTKWPPQVVVSFPTSSYPNDGQIPTTICSKILDSRMSLFY